VLFAALLKTQTEPAFAQPQASPPASSNILILEIEKTVESQRAGAAAWDAAFTNQNLSVGDSVRTREWSRATLRLSDLSHFRMNELSEIQIQPPASPKARPSFNFLNGILYFFHRDKPADIHLTTPTASAAIRGTEFNLQVDPNGRTILTMIDGVVELTNAQGQITLNNGEQGTVEPGQPPTKTAVVQTINVIQWCLYYPAILDPDELGLSADEKRTLNDSLSAYRSGDLLEALAKYPAGRQPASEDETVYLAALLLTVGQVEKTESLLASLPPAAGRRETFASISAGAIRQLIAAVKVQPWPRVRLPELATEWLAESYYQQSGAVLDDALAAARRAADKSPKFGFAWERVAELEFSFGRVPEALAALEKSLALSPRNAQALALKGFLLGAQNRISQAIAYFDRAIAIDGALGNAWLGRGLCQIRRGHPQAGREDLQMAAAQEPNRALLRSYLGKAYANAGDRERAAKELQRGKDLDPKDPTAWLYSALLNQQENRINEAVRDLEESEELNDNRRVYRSRLLLDQDRAVRGANLANIYRDDGMTDVSVREAARAVSDDYANYSAHLFLASSYNELRDPNLINLRYETPAEVEYLLANLLAPVGAGTLSPTISQQEYSKLFERDRFGVVSSTEYLSRGAWTESGAQYGILGNSSYSLEAFYRTDPGQRPNNNVEQRQLSLLLKQQLTPQDIIYAQVIHTELSGGDLVQYFYQTNFSPDFRFVEKQEPFVTLGYHHEWSPGVHTVFLAARLHDQFAFTNSAQPTILIRDPALDTVDGLTMSEVFQGKLEIYSAELQQIWQQPVHTTIAGIRVQYGHFDTKNLQTMPSTDGPFFPDPPAPEALQDIRSLFRRVSFYGYHFWQIVEPLQLIGGVTYDRLTFPENFRTAPISDRQETVDRISPKAGLIWTPAKDTTVRFAYTRSLAGASLDQSFQLEPSQVAGFIQSYRSIIPESVEGANAGARFETFGLSLEQKFPSGTYLGVAGEILNSKVRRTVGAFLYPLVSDSIPSGLREHLDYDERSVICTFNQLVAREWSVGVRYRLNQAELSRDFVDIPPGATATDFQPKQDVESVLHQLSLYTIYSHHSGFFGQFQALWYLQSNAGYSPDQSGDHFWQLNAFAGYRFPGRKAEFTIGVLNLADRDYRLNPLTLYNELPRERTFVARLQFSF
jgi:tetratricopeptide (TPR) repeat protein